MNKNARLENFSGWLNEELKDPAFKKAYEQERTKVALAQKIAELRHESHLNQAQFAQKLHVSQQYVSRLETGKETNLTIDTLVRIAVTLGRDVRVSFPKSAPKRQSHFIVV
jgi:predicted XRE-type DNA-binding protein